MLSLNPQGVHLLEKNVNKIYGGWLSSNPGALELLKKYPHLIDWEELSINPQGISLLEKNQDKILSFDQALSKVNNSLFYKLINLSLEKILKLLRFFNKTKD